MILEFDLLKRYWVFLYQYYEEQGGLQDLTDTFDTIEEVKEAINAKSKYIEAVDVLDAEQRKIIYSSRETALRGLIISVNLLD